MKKTLQKPFVLTLLLLIISYVVGAGFMIIQTLLRIKHSSIVEIPFAFAIASLFLGIIYTSIYKMEIPKNNKIKIILNYFFTTLGLFLGLLVFICCYLHMDLYHIKEFFIGMQLPFFLIIIGSFCMYPALGLGCKVILKSIEKNEKQKQMKV